MESYLDQSLGLIVYQDDVLLTAINLAGYNWEEADKFRKAMGKKIPEEMMKQKEKFVNGCKQVGKLKDSLIDVLWKRIEPFAAYGFNKAHAASYAVVAYQTAYMKANFPTQYMTAILIAESGDIDKVPPVIHECGRMGVKVLPPDINESFKSFAMIPKDETHEVEHIRFGLNGIKNLGEHIAEVIYRERKNNGKYKDLEDFLKRVKDRDLNKKSVESLVKCGALDSFGYDRNQLLMNIENIISFCKHSQEDSSKKQFTLFSGTAIDVAHKLRLDPAPPATESQKMTWEKELLGLYVTSHPFAQFQKIMQQSLTPIKDLGGQSRNKWVVVGGVIDSTKKKITRAGKPMMFVTIQDTTSSLELLVFPKTYETTKEVWIEGKMACVIGKTSEDEGDDKLFVEKAYELTSENVHDLAQQLSIGSSVSAKNTSPQEDYSMLPVHEDIHPPLLVLVDAVEIIVSPQVMKDKAEELKMLFGNYPGNKTVFLKVGEKKIKTSFSVDGSEEFQKEILGVL